MPTPVSTVSDQEGFFRLVDLAPADYRLEAELAGFSKYVRDPVAVRAGLNISFDIELSLGGVEEVVEVSAETPLLETQRAGTAVNISGQFQRDLPLDVPKPVLGLPRGDARHRGQGG